MQKEENIEMSTRRNFPTKIRISTRRDGMSRHNAHFHKKNRKRGERMRDQKVFRPGKENRQFLKSSHYYYSYYLYLILGWRVHFHL
jgi:hypothetical protein